MSSFYIFLAIAILLASLLGYLAGFMRIIFLCIKIGLSVTAAYFLHPVVADMLSDNFTVIAAWSQAAAFVSIFLFSFILLLLLFAGIEKRTARFNKTIFNKIGGGITGLASGVATVLLVIQFTDVIGVPKEMQDEIDQRGITAAIDKPVEFINNKFFPVFQKQPTQVMALKTPGSIPEAGITLSYVTGDFEMRHDLETTMLGMINKERNDRGLKSLSADAELAAAATAHSADMFKRGYFSHNTPEGIDPFQRLHQSHIIYLYAGENLAMAPTLLKAHDGLMRSPGHRANILNPSYGRVGIGILDAGAHGLMITQEFRN